MDRIAFVGVGTMGRPMARRLIEAGYSVTVAGRNQAALADWATAGAQVGKVGPEIAASVDVIMLSLPSSKAVESVVYEPCNLLEGIRPETIIIDMGSSDPASTKRIAADLEKRNAFMLDAPVSGGEVGAVKGTLTCMVGGPKDIFDKCLPIFKTLASTITYVGDTGMGHTLKLINNMVGVTNLVLLCEAFSVAQALGLDLQVVRQVMASGSANSAALGFWGERLISKEYEKPTYRFNLAAKDMRLAQAMAASSGVPYPVFAGTHLVFTIASAMGLEMEDVSAIKLIWDRLVSQPKSAP